MVLTAVTAAALAFIRRYPFLFVGWFWYLGTLVPMIGLVQIGGQQMADRYTYFPLIGVCLAVVWLGAELRRRDSFASGCCRWPAWRGSGCSRA